MAAALDQARKAYHHATVENDVLWRWGLNLRPTLSFRREGITLGPEARRVADQLLRDGVVMTDAHTLLGPDDTTVAAVRDYVEGLVTDHGDEIAATRAALDAAEPGASKSYLVELLGPLPQTSGDDPIARFLLHPQVRGVAEAYAGMRLRIHDYNAWYNVAHDAPATQSQRWHRDLPEDHVIPKVFLYVRDVPEGAGPLSYVARTHAGELKRYSPPTEWDGIGHRISDEAIEQIAGEGDLRTVPGPVGSIVFADGRGLHRGGWARDTDRLVVQGLYATRSVRRPGTLRLAPNADRETVRRDFNVMSPAMTRRREHAVGLPETSVQP